MPNHFHLLVQTAAVGLSRILSSFMTRYVQRINWDYCRVGHLFQSRCKTILCEKDPHFLELVRYIPLNPVRCGLVHRPQDWHWSSYRLFYGLKIPQVKNLPKIEIQEMLSRFSSDLKNAPFLFRKFLQKGIGEGHREDLYPKGNIPILGSKAFIEEVLTAQGIEPQRKLEYPERIRIPMERLVQIITQIEGFSLGDLRRSNYQRKLVRLRGEIAYLANRHANISLSKLGEYLGVSSAALSWAAIKTQDRFDGDSKRLKYWLKQLKAG